MSELTVLITGASSGIGLELAKVFALRRYSLVLVARRTDKLEHLATQLQRDHSVRADVIVADLSRPDAPLG